MVDEAMFSSDNQEWCTPKWLFDELEAEFSFDLDAAATDENNKCGTCWTKEEDSLKCPWYSEERSIKSVYLNPPYGRDIGLWIAKAYTESQKGATVVCLLPARTDTAWFHDYVLGKAEIRFIRGRLRFETTTGETLNSAPFPSMIVIFKPSWLKAW